MKTAEAIFELEFMSADDIKSVSGCSDEKAEEVFKVLSDVISTGKTAEDKEIEQLKKRILVLKDALRESQDWDWLTAKETSEEKGIEYFDIDSMQELFEIAQTKEYFE